MSRTPVKEHAARRLGTETSATRTELLDAAERLMLDEGYAAVTSRRVAAAAGLKPQLIHYYFRTMDDLFLALYRRRADQGLERQTLALGSAQPLWALWDLSRDPRGTALTMEFVALANHRKAIRAEIAASAEQYRAGMAKGVEAVFSRYRLNEQQYPPLVWAVLLTSISVVLVLEQESIGLSSGHAETVAFVEDWLCQIEGPRQSLGTTGRTVRSPRKGRSS
ncbi:MAG TPA: helix-turn-helix domain-containing protein [Acidimicrobiales bacterium]|jgi:AcrR family transcriptional regulator